tara:strand:+ start:11496 stop:12212 length:717 start_codon:yes stop_codon:yes gene_type:complete
MNSLIKNNEIDLKQISRVYKKRWKLFALTFLLSIVIGVAIHINKPKIYKSTSIISIGSQLGKVIEPIEGVIMILQSNANPQGLTHPDSLKKISFFYKGNSLVIEAVAKNPDKAFAQTKSSVDYLMMRHNKIFENLLSPLKLEINKTENDISKIIEKIGDGNIQANEIINARYISQLTMLKETKTLIMNKTSQFVPTKIEIYPIKPKYPFGPKLMPVILLSLTLGFIFISIFVLFKDSR